MANDIGKDLESLFSIFTTQLLEEVKAAAEAGIPIAAADKAAIIRFLQVNNITYTPADKDELEQLRLRLAERSALSKGKALNALREAHDDLAALYPEATLQ